MIPLSVSDLVITLGGRVLLDGVSLTVAPGERVGLVGESGSGKSLTALTVLGLLAPGMRATGAVECCGIDPVTASPDALRALRGGLAALVFQDPMQALAPLRSIGKQMRDVMAAHAVATGGAARAQGLALLARLGLEDPERVWASLPFQLSGGQRQRALIAIGLAPQPRLVIADEVTTALDADAIDDVLALFDLHLVDPANALLLISHDLSVVARACNRVLVMRAGRIVESGPARAILDTPRHPYTRALLDALPARGTPKTPLAAP